MLMETYQPCYTKAFESVGLDSEGRVVKTEEITNDHYTNYSNV